MYSCASDALEAPWQLAEFITTSASPPPSSSLLPKTFGFSAITRINPLFVEENSLSINIDNNNANGDKIDEIGITSSKVAVAVAVATTTIIDDTVQDVDDPDLRRYISGENIFVVADRNRDFIRSVSVSVRVCRRSSPPDHVGVRGPPCLAECLLLPNRSRRRRRRRRRIHVEKSFVLRVISQSNETESLPGLNDRDDGEIGGSRAPNLRRRHERYRRRYAAKLYKKKNCFRDPSPESSAATNSRSSTSTSLPLRTALRRLRYKIERCLRSSKSATWPPPSRLSPENGVDAGALDHRKSRYRCRINRLDRDRALGYSDKFAHFAAGQHFWKPRPLQSPSSPSPSPPLASSILSFFSAASTSALSDASASVPIFNSSTWSQTAAAAAVLASNNDRFQAGNLEPRPQFSIGGTFHRDDDRLQFARCQEIGGVLRTDASSLRLGLPTSYLGRRGLDFTLDAQQAEKVVRKLENRKRSRCWCRIATCVIGFAFLLFSVMLFSMALTRGEKLFGPSRSVY